MMLRLSQIVTKSAFFTLLLAALIFNFQNCSETKFSEAVDLASESAAPPAWVPPEALKPKFLCRNPGRSAAYATSVTVGYGESLECIAESANFPLSGYNQNLTLNSVDAVRPLDATNGWTHQGGGLYHFGPVPRTDHPRTTRYQVFVRDRNGLESSVETIFIGKPDSFSWNDSGSSRCAMMCGAQTVAVEFICLDSSGNRVADANCTEPKPTATRICINEPPDSFRDLIRISPEGHRYNEMCTCSTLGVFAGPVQRTDSLNRKCYEPVASCADGYRLESGACVL